MAWWKRKPDEVIGGEENPYLLRWHLIPRNRFFNIYLHKILRDDDSRALHDHPWASCSFILKNGYIEVLPRHIYKRRKPWRIYFRRADQAHRIILLRAGWNMRVPSWSIFITGPKIREWGFHCPKGWTHWKEYCDEKDHGKVGKGCA